MIWKIFLCAVGDAAYNPEMSLSPATPAIACAVARANIGAGMAALILALLVRLLGRTEAAWTLFPKATDALEYTPHAIRMSAVGRAPHAACIEAGLVPDWLLPGMRNRGMRPSNAPARLRRRARPARAPPIPYPVLS